MRVSVSENFRFFFQNVHVHNFLLDHWFPSAHHIINPIAPPAIQRRSTSFVSFQAEDSIHLLPSQCWSVKSSLKAEAPQESSYISVSLKMVYYMESNLRLYNLEEGFSITKLKLNDGPFSFSEQVYLKWWVSIERYQCVIGPFLSSLIFSY